MLTPSFYTTHNIALELHLNDPQVQTVNVIIISGLHWLAFDWYNC